MEARLGSESDWWFSATRLNTSQAIRRNQSLRAGFSPVELRWVMAKIIEFYVPSGFRKKASKWIPPEQCGKVIPFGVPEKKSA